MSSPLVIDRLAELKAKSSGVETYIPPEPELPPQAQGNVQENSLFAMVHRIHQEISQFDQMTVRIESLHRDCLLSASITRARGNELA